MNQDSELICRLQRANELMKQSSGVELDDAWKFSSSRLVYVTINVNWNCTDQAQFRWWREIQFSFTFNDDAQKVEQSYAVPPLRWFRVDNFKDVHLWWFIISSRRHEMCCAWAWRRFSQWIGRFLEFIWCCWWTSSWIPINYASCRLALNDFFRCNETWDFKCWFPYRTCWRPNSRTSFWSQLRSCRLISRQPTTRHFSPSSGRIQKRRQFLEETSTFRQVNKTFQFPQ